jgi:alkylresorcinol/alkylpyrone synthase
MGWQVTDDGLSVLFSRDIPHHVRTLFADAMDGFLHGQGLCRGDIDAYVPHPGGAKVLDAMEAVFGLPEGGLKEAREILRHYGNMSAVTVLFVLQAALRAARPEARRYLLSSLGPGFTAAFAVLERE